MTTQVETATPSVNWANRLTVLRLLLSPVFVIVFITWRDTVAGAIASLAIVIVSELTDLFDGMVARRMNQVSDFGKLLDPMADSLSRVTIFVCFVATDIAGPYTIYLVIPIMYRDAMLSTLRTFCAHRGVVVAARWAGKIKAVVQAIVILIILTMMVVAQFREAAGDPVDFRHLYFWLISIATFVTIVSAFDYVRANWGHLRATIRGEG